MIVKSAPGLKGSTVLIMDDVPANLRVLVDCLEDQGYAVAVAQDGEEGLKRARLIHPDLILLDLRMPVMDGFEVCRQLKASEATSDIPVIFMTASGSAEDKVTGFDVGGVDYVTKPFQMDEVLARVRTHLSIRRMQREIEQQNLRLREEMLAREETQRELRAAQKVKAEAERLKLLERLVNVQEEERRRIARELHDEIGQSLTGLSLGLKKLQAQVQDPRGLETLAWLEQLTGQIGRDVHRTAWELRPTALDDIGLVKALETYVGDWAERSGVQVVLEAEALDGRRFTTEVETAVYRVIQEAMTNVLKHAGASVVRLALSQRDSELHLVIADDGKGIDPGSLGDQTRLGLAGMRERLAPLRGTLVIDSGAQSGAILRVRIPLPRDDAAGNEAV
ncbi:ATP-binding response regulator [Phenylobacterium montanum]|uniref:histidine kinase n=1 Tax=Phenylobacterium montanum TaxID=2823693 RepID=A0A975FVW9_9CAUL|nr:response regulator [Caulobacter sp. S6]QUD85944.1 response regulator [Caulobacter sp. S6]